MNEVQFKTKPTGYTHVAVYQMEPSRGGHGRWRRVATLLTVEGIDRLAATMAVYLRLEPWGA